MRGSSINQTSHHIQATTLNRNQHPTPAIMADQSQAPKIDSVPISNLERRDSLEKHLQHRPDPQDLKNRNILLDTNAAP